MPAQRHKVNYRYDGLNWNFLKLLAEIASYANEKYGSPEQYTESPLTGDRSPINHIAEHMRAYMAGELHDKFGTREHQLAAIAYNASMEYFYLTQGHGATTSDALYRPVGTYAFIDGKPLGKQDLDTAVAQEPLTPTSVEQRPAPPILSAKAEESPFAQLTARIFGGRS